MKAALLPDRGVIKVVGDDARNFLHGLVSADILALAPGAARFCALLTPQGKIIADFLNWMVDDGQKMTADLTYAPLPASVVTKVKDEIKQVR